MPDSAVMKIVGNSFCRGFNVQDESASDGDLDFAAHGPYHQWANQANCTLSSSVVREVMIPSFDVAHVPGAVQIVGAGGLGAGAMLFAESLGRVVQVCYDLAPIAKHIKWGALSRHRAATEYALFGPGPGEQRGEGVLTRLGEKASAASGPDVTDLTQYLLAFSTLDYARMLVARVIELAQDIIDEGEGERISSTSLFSLIRFLELNPTVRRPTLAAGKGGYIVARWIAAEGRQVNVHFLANGNAHYYAFMPDQEQPGAMEFLTASTTMESISKRLAEVHILEWMA